MHHQCSNILTFIIIYGLQAYLANAEHEESKPKMPAGYMRREYSLGKPLTGGATTQHWTLAGSTMLTDEWIRLTSDEQSKSGGVWNNLPCFVRDWEVHIQLKVHGHNSRFYGDGLAFWYTKDRNELGQVFGSKDFFMGLGIFFDTYANQNGEHAHEHPYISGQINNGSITYDHDRDGTHSELDGCTSHFRGSDHETHFAVRYTGSEKRLTVLYDVEDEGKWTSCFDRFGVNLPTGYYFGFSSSTGDLSDNHDLISVKFYELDSNDATTDGEQKEVEDYTKIVPSAQGASEERPHSDDLPTTTRSQQLFNWFLGFVFIALVLGVVGFLYYQKYQQDQLKRFY